MFPYIIEEFSWATMQEREIEAQEQRRPRPWRAPSHVRTFVARTLVHAGLHLDRKAGELASQHGIDQGY